MHLPLFCVAMVRSTTGKNNFAYSLFYLSSKKVLNICVFLHDAHNFFSPFSQLGFFFSLYFIYLHINDENNDNQKKMPTKPSRFLKSWLVFRYSLSAQCVREWLFTLCKRFDSINALFLLPFCYSYPQNTYFFFIS